MNGRSAPGGPFGWIGGHELALWVLVVFIALGAWGFAELADHVMAGETRAFDRTVLLALRTPSDPHDPLGPFWVEEVVRDFSALGGMGLITFISVAAFGFLLLQRKFRGALLLALAISGGGALSALLKMNFDRPRPELVAYGTHAFDSSFPSGHAMMAAIVYLSLGAVMARMQSNIYLKGYIILLSLVLTVVIGLSRIYLGVHWPTDVLAGWLVGALYALSLWLLTRWLQRKNTVEDGERSSGDGG